jgi:hypothetical protein
MVATATALKAQYPPKTANLNLNEAFCTITFTAWNTYRSINIMMMINIHEPETRCISMFEFKLIWICEQLQVTGYRFQVAACTLHPTPYTF